MGNRQRPGKLAFCLNGDRFRDGKTISLAQFRNLHYTSQRIAPRLTRQKALGRGYLFMATAAPPLSEPATKRAIVFVDGQNLFNAAKEAFGYHFPNYNVRCLAEAICRDRRWNLVRVHFYTGVPDRGDDAPKSAFWTAKLAAMGRQGIVVFTRALRYRNKTVRLPDGNLYTFLHGEEKGIDVRIALDVISMAVRNEYDVAVVFSQDQDLSEVADELRVIARQQGRWIKIACPFPMSPTRQNRRGINGADWIPLDRAAYDACIDPRDYRPPKI